ncbi:nitroreductase family protein [Paenibacillus nanensis]|uniref:Nitroreductase family protein n=1 Tax=Paenibacillus nanensis TaxID=393251 RepID=A0A3A1UW18_9BACL|nr:nitroreductase family protein [Paenibacillus nanensis]RIX48655.1 nitroreductase family protein [Paenibacillus nanensis]
MSTKTNSKLDFFALLKERHAVKRYDSGYRMVEEDILALLQAASDAPSAWNLQHWKFLTITDQAHKETLLDIAFGQRQVVEASAVVAILGDLQADRNAEKVFGSDVQAGRMSVAIKSRLISQINLAYENKNWARDQAICNASLAAMQLMLAAKAMGLDSCPIGGFDPGRLIEAFAIPDRYVPVMLISVGKAAEPARPSERLPIEESVVWNRF